MKNEPITNDPINGYQCIYQTITNVPDSGHSMVAQECEQSLAEMFIGVIYLVILVVIAHIFMMLLKKPADWILERVFRIKKPSNLK